MRRSRVIAGLVGLLGAAVAAGFALRLPPSPPSDAFHGLVVAHRGGSEAGPENTVTAIELAAAAGATAIEVDVLLSADGVPMVIHDPTVDRTTGARGEVGGMTASELGALDAAAYRDDFEDVRVPTLLEVIEVVERLDLRLEIELKGKTRDPGTLVAVVAALFAERDLYDRAWVASFDPRLLYRVRRTDPRIVTGLAFRRRTTGFPPVDAALVSAWLPRLLGVGVIEPHVELVDADSVAAWRARGYAVNAWTANSAAEQSRLRGLGVSYTTNCPFSNCEDHPTDGM